MRKRTRKSYGGKRNVTAYANRVMRKKYPNYYAKKNANQAAFMNMSAAANAMINKNKKQANAAAKIANKVVSNANTMQSAAQTLKTNASNVVQSTTGQQPATNLNRSVNIIFNQAKKLKILANNAKKLSNTLRSMANINKMGGSRRNRSRRNRN